MSDFGRELYERDVKRRLLALREDLIRHDENEKALALMEDCVPFYLQQDPEIDEARERTRRQSGHVRDPAQYRDYYAANVHERPFEEQYGLTAEDAHRLPRVAFLRGALAALHAEQGRELRVLDLAGNDGFMAANLASLPFPVVCDLVDLHPGNCALAEQRKAAGAPIALVIEGDAVGVASDLDRLRDFADTESHAYDAVVAFEVIEHVADPRALLEAMRQACAAHGFLFVSTPCGVDHGGNLPDWDRDEPKGHVRVYVEDTFRAELGRAGEILQFMTGPDGVMVAQVRPTV